MKQLKAPVNPKSSYGLFSQEFLRNHGAQLLGTASTWFLLDIAFYSLNLTQKDVYPSAGLINMASSMNAIEEMYHLSRAMSLIALVAIVPVIGYYRIYENIISIVLFWNLHHYYIYIYKGLLPIRLSILIIFIVVSKPFAVRTLLSLSLLQLAFSLPFLIGFYCCCRRILPHH
jgi:hypothetical protein